MSSQPKSSDTLFSALKKLRELFTRRDKIGFGILLIGMVVGAVLETFSVAAIPAFISAVMSPEKIMRFKPAAAVLKNFGITTSRDILLWGSLALIVIFLVKTLYLCLQYYLQTRYVQNRQFRLTRRMFTAYMNAPYQFHLRRNSAELFRNTLQEVGQIMGGVVRPFLDLTMQGLMMLAILALLFASQPLMALVATAVIGLAGGGYQWWVKGKLRAYSLEAQEHRKLMVKTLQEGLGVIKEIRVLHREKNFIETFVRSLWRTMKAMRYQIITNKITAPYMEFIAIVGLLSIAIFLILMGREAESIAPTLALFAVAFVRLKTSISQVVSGINQLRFGVVSINPVYHDLKMLENKKTHGANTNIKDNAPQRLRLSRQLSLEGVWYRYPESEEYALKDIHLTLPRGHSIAFVGPTGAGKTTIVDVILGLLEPEKGRITVDGKDIHANLPAWQRNIGYIPQSIYLTDDTIRHNVALGLDDKEISEEHLWQAVRAAQLESFVRTLPQGIDTVIGERGVRLSGGQRQRIGIARALYHNPEVLIMDEATSALDNATERSVIQALDALKGDRTIIMIAHRLTTVQNCDTLYFMKNGQIESFGNYSDLLSSNREFREMAQTG
ncbi:MAG: ABC transporter ATP-binding protein [Methanosarcinales archaeon]|nr:MAG: ABC transporter ATP-binding protein [Methanosarcinales archaeon]